jgi:hypothetical protein
VVFRADVLGEGEWDFCFWFEGHGDGWVVEWGLGVAWWEVEGWIDCGNVEGLVLLMIWKAALCLFPVEIRSDDHVVVGE